MFVFKVEREKMGTAEDDSRMFARLAQRVRLRMSMCIKKIFNIICCVSNKQIFSMIDFNNLLLES
jgi:hypothetical protein